MTRTIAVAVIGTEADLAAVSWAAAGADDGDCIHIVHPYELYSFAESSWQPAVRANDTQRQEARHIVAAATQWIRSTHRHLDVDGSAIVGGTLRVLTDVSAIVDLLVVSDCAATDGARVSLVLAGRSACPVVVVPTRSTKAWAKDPDLPVALLIDATSFPTPAIEFAFAEAARRKVALIVSETCGSARDGLPVSADDASPWEPADATFCEDLAPWRTKYEGVPVIVEVHRQPLTAVARLMHNTCQLLVTSRGSRSTGPLGRVARLAVRDATSPVAVVPDRQVEPVAPMALGSHRAKGH